LEELEVFRLEELDFEELDELFLDELEELDELDVCLFLLSATSPSCTIFDSGLAGFLAVFTVHSPP
jgi:uncharacterized protein YbbK (DUF523 family)